MPKPFLRLLCAANLHKWGEKAIMLSTGEIFTRSCSRCGKNEVLMSGLFEPYWASFHEWSRSENQPPLEVSSTAETGR